MKKSKIVALTSVAYLTLLVLGVIFTKNDKVFMPVFIVFLGYSLFNIVALIVFVYKFIKNKISGKKDEPIIINQKETFISSNNVEQQTGNEAIGLIEQKADIKNENKTTLAKKTARTGLGCLLAPFILFIGYILFAMGGLMIMGLVGGVYSAIPPSWKSCTGVVILVDPITHTNSIFGKKGGEIYYKSGGNDFIGASCKILKNADSNSFEVVGEKTTVNGIKYEAKDKNNLYWGGKIVRANVNEK